MAHGGSSPRSRGAPVRPEKLALSHGIIPAFAGSTPGLARRLGVPGDHPRVRGEHATTALSWSANVGSSPRSRGALNVLCGRAAVVGIIPAFAGSTPGYRTCQCGSRDHPRVRGEHAFYFGRQFLEEGSSPRSRGALGEKRVPIKQRGIIPAFAGSTVSADRSGWSTWDHPRVRGEHAQFIMAGSAIMGSSPRSRGALSRPLLCGPLLGIIPAFAGSTAP